MLVAGDSFFLGFNDIAARRSEKIFDSYIQGNSNLVDYFHVLRIAVAAFIVLIGTEGDAEKFGKIILFSHDWYTLLKYR